MLEFMNSLHPIFLWMIFAVVAGFCTVVGIVLSFHWREYAIDSHKTMHMMKLYLIVSITLGLIMLISALLYQYGT